MVLIKYDKKKVILSNSLYSILNQLSFYKKYNYLNNPFISKIFYAFQDKSSFYIVKKYYSGGDLRYHMSRKIFSEQKAKFIVGHNVLRHDAPILRQYFSIDFPNVKSLKIFFST